MKRNLLGLTAVVLAIAICSFTGKKFDTVYFKYKGGVLTEKSLSSYNLDINNPGEMDGIERVAWFQGTAAIPSAPTSTEFNNAFEAVDGDYGGSDNDQLSDELSEDHTTFEKKD